MNAAELALLADPKALLTYASSLINMIVSGEVSPDGVVDTQLAAHTTHGSPAEAPAQPAAPEAEKPKLVVIDRLGTNPVVEPLTDAEKAKGTTVIEKGFEDTTDNGINDSAIEKSAREVAARLGMSPEETERFLKWVHENKQHFIDASKVDNYNEGGFKDVVIQKGEAVMGNGSGGAQDVKLDLKEPEKAVRGIYTMSDGTKVNFDIFDKCGNPTMSPVPEESVAPAPAPAPTCPDKHDWRFTVKESQGGIDMDGDGAPEHKIPVLEAPSDMTLEEARTVLENSDWKDLKDGESKRFLLWIDSNCDGHPEKIECVTVTRDGDEVKVDVKPFDTKPGPGVKNYDDLDTDKQKKWVGTP